MELKDNLLKKIIETKYLATENSHRYRVIMRYFYDQYNKFNYWLYKEDVYEALKSYDLFNDYTLEQCIQDLESLKQWKSLNAVQDTSKANTIEEFKNKSYRYQMSEYAIEIERMAIRLENLFVEGASLQPNLMEKIKNHIINMDKLVYKDINEIGAWWEDLTSDFKRLNQNYQDYIRDWQSVKADEMMQTESFLMTKDKFIEYLRTFIKNLQVHVGTIEDYINQVNKTIVKEILDAVVEYKNNIPRIDMGEHSQKEMKDNIYGQWASVKSWFISDKSISEAEQVFEMTNEIIRRITRYAAQIVESANQRANRKEEYRKIAQLFQNYESIEDCHSLSSEVFGISRPRHLKGNMIRETESIHASVYEEGSYEYALKPRIRTYREKTKRTAIIDRKEEREALRMEIIKKRQEEDELIAAYCKDDVMDFSQLETINSEVRGILLRWLTKGLSSEDRMGKTENGKVFQVIPPDHHDSCILVCDDGELEMPAFKLSFKGGEQ